MRWGLALGAAASLGAAALITTQWSGQPAATAPATASTAPSRDAIAQGLRQAAGAEGLAVAGALTSGMGLTLIQSVLALEATPEATIDRSEDVPADAEGPAGQRRVTMKMRVQGSGSRLTLHADFEAQEQRGASRVNARSRLTATLDYCPDKDGKVVAEIDFQGSGDTAVNNVAGTAGYSVNIGVKGQATGSVNDQAVLTHIAKQLSGTTSTRVGRNPNASAGQGSGTRKASSGSYAFSSNTPLDSPPTPDGANVSLKQGAGATGRLELGSSDDPQLTSTLAGFTQLWLDLAIQSIFEKAQAKWRNGACLELLVRPPVQAGGKPNPTQAKERKNFEVAVRHKSEQAELPLPIDATLDGRDTLEPKRVEKAPGRFDYVAGADPKDYGNVALKSVSRRGIAQERVAFDNQQHLGGAFSARTSGVMQAQAEGRVSWQAKPGAPDEFVPSGSVRVAGTRRKCTVRGEADLAEGDGELLVKRDAEGKPIEYLGRGIKMMALHFTCPRVSATQTVPVAWFGTAETFRPIGSDGSMEGSLDQGIVHWTWRFTR
jgi:hypothetical protein